ncbi:hypothetical protein GALL_406890 [mine drainage metagenome]|uniref:Uncharacterized protein n=1 Tax=mine drainage metagenome TaxID=410659 RepID=A0A1J5QJD1_9ZZZZ
MTIDFKDHVTALESGFLPRPVGINARYQRTFGLGQMERISKGLVNFLNGNPQAGVAGVSGGHNLVLDASCQLDRNGKGQALIAARAAVDLRVDAHDLATGIEQRPAGVARIDGHIGLDKGQVVAGITLFGTDNARRDGVFQTKRRANGHHPFTDTQAADITHLDGRQASGLDFDQGHIAALVSYDDFGLELALVGQCDDHLIRAVNHVGVGHDQAV